MTNEHITPTLCEQHMLLWISSLKEAHDEGGDYEFFPAILGTEAECMTCAAALPQPAKDALHLMATVQFTVEVPHSKWEALGDYGLQIMDDQLEEFWAAVERMANNAFTNCTITMEVQ